MDNNQTQGTVSFRREVFENICNGFLFAFAVAGWLLKTVFLGLCDVTGYLSIKFYQFVLSPAAFRRYWRGLVASWRFAVKTYLFIEGRCEYVSMRVQHIFYYRGRVGLVIFDVSDEERDGYLILRTFGNERMATMNFRCTNRWMARKNQPLSYHLNDIMSQSLDSGLYVAHLYWKDCLMKPYDVAALGIIKPAIHDGDRQYLSPARHWVPETPSEPLRLDPRKFQDIIHQA
jgi:hypothetical protein